MSSRKASRQTHLSQSKTKAKAVPAAASTKDLCTVCKSECMDLEIFPEAASSLCCLRCEKWAHFACAGVVLPDGVVINMDSLHFVCKDCEPSVRKAVQLSKQDVFPKPMSGEAYEDDRLSTLGDAIKKLTEEVSKLKHPTSTAEPITSANITELADHQQRQLNLIMTNVKIDISAEDGGIAEVNNFFDENFGIPITERIVEDVMQIGDPDRKMLKIRFKNQWKRSAVLRKAPVILATLPMENGKRPSLKPDYSFRERQERRRLGDEVSKREGGWEKFTIRRGQIVERT
jgi:hypothetical protein